MRRLTSVLAHVLPMMAAVGFVITPSALAQTTVQPSMPATPPPGVVIPMATPEFGQQRPNPGTPQGQTTPPASTPRLEPPRAPNVGGPNNTGMPAHTNIRLELVITDNFTGSPVKKTVSMLVLQNNGGMIRTSSLEDRAVLNVDAIAAAYTTGMVSVRITFEYTPGLTRPPASNENVTAGRPPRLNESITVVLQDGKPMVVSQSADPATDRKVTAELTATILK